MKKLVLTLILVFLLSGLVLAKDYSGTYVSEQGTTVIVKKNGTYFVTIESNKIPDCKFSDMTTFYRDTAYKTPKLFLRGNDTIFTVDFIGPDTIEVNVPMVTDGGRCNLYGKFLKQ